MAEGRVCKESAVYPFEFCKAILMGCRRQLVMDGRLVVGIIGIQRREEEMSYESFLQIAGLKRLVLRRRRRCAGHEFRRCRIP